MTTILSSGNGSILRHSLDPRVRIHFKTANHTDSKKLHNPVHRKSVSVQYKGLLFSFFRHTSKRGVSCNALLITFAFISLKSKHKTTFAEINTLTKFIIHYLVLTFCLIMLNHLTKQYISLGKSSF